MKIFKFRSSLMRKWVVFQIAAFGLILLLAGFYQYRSIRSLIYEEVEESGDTVSQSIKEMLTENPELFNVKTLQPMILRLTRKVADIKHISVIDQSGQTIVDSDHRALGKTINTEIVQKLLRENGRTKTYFQSAEGNFLRLKYSLEGPYDASRKSNIIGVLVIDFSLTRDEEKINAAFQERIWMLTGLFVIFWLVQYIFARRGFLRWLENLTLAARRFGNGDFTARATVKTKDQLGQLAAAFNQMAAKVEHSDAALKSEIKEREQAEDALDKKSEFLAAVLDNISNGIVACDADGTLTLFNRATREFHGLPEVPIPADQWAEHYDLYLSDGKTLMTKEQIPLFRALQEGAVHNVEMVIAPKDGPARRLIANGQAIIDANGVKRGAVVGMHDITKRFEIERNLRESEARFRNLVETLPFVVYEVKPHPPYAPIYISPKIEVFGYSVDDCFNQPDLWINIIHPDDRESVLRATEEKMRQNHENEYEYRIVDSKGKIHWIYDKGRFCFDKENNPILWQGIMLDITERKRTEEELKSSEMQLAEAQRIAHVGSWEWDIKADKVMWSDEEFRIFGLEPQEFEPTYAAFLERVHPDDREFVKKEIEKAYREKWYEGFEHRIVRPDGVTRVCRADGKVILDDDGNPSKMLGTECDITEQKQIEAQIKKAHDAALESTRLKSEFLANMSHEIRTPMNGVIGMTGLLLDTELDEEQRDYAEMIRQSADSLLTIINDILDFSKIEAGKLSFETLDFDLRNTVESTVGLLAERAQSKGVELASLVADDVPTLVRGDAGRLRQVLLNLVGNAVKFTGRGEVAVWVKKEAETDSHVTIRFSVRDTGIGIPEEARKNLFQAFVQADGSTTRKYGGTGLGLVISKQIVELMGGEIGVQSKEGKGSTFWFVLRLEKQPVDFTKTLAPRTDLRGLRVLIVDDNATNRKILNHQTTSWGMLPREAANGRDALEMLRAAAQSQEPFDLALLDFDMPEMNGFELARAIKSDRRVSVVRLVLMPSFGNRGDGQMAREIGISAYLIKPVKQSQLFDCLAAVMGENARQTSSASPPDNLITRYSIEENKYAARARILIAEDNPVNQKLTRRQVEKLGYTADIVGNGLEVLNALSKTSYDVVLMDCQMPKMDGYAATAEIRRREGSDRHTVVIALTAHALEGEREKCLAAGMDDYLSKPVDAGELEEKLAHWLNSTKFAKASSDQNKISASKPVSPPVDMNKLSDAAGDDVKLRRELIGLYLGQMSENIEKLKAAAKAKNPDEIKRIVHTSLGSSATCGMTAVLAPLRELERADFEAKGFDRRMSLIASLEYEFGRVREFLESFLLKVKE